MSPIKKPAKAGLVGTVRVVGYAAGMKLFIGILFAALVGGLALFLIENGRDFALGTLFGIAIYQLAFFAKYKQFID